MIILLSLLSLDILDLVYKRMEIYKRINGKLSRLKWGASWLPFYRTSWRFTWNFMNLHWKWLSYNLIVGQKECLTVKLSLQNIGILDGCVKISSITVPMITL